MAVSAAALVAIVGRAPSLVAAADDSNIAERVANARTAADHEAITKFYEDEATTARRKAEEHRKMGGAVYALHHGQPEGAASALQHAEALRESR